MTFITVPSGNYTGTVVDYGVMETKKGKLLAFTKVKINVNGTPTTLTWFGGVDTFVTPGKKMSPWDFTMLTFKKICPHFESTDLKTYAKSGNDTAKLLNTEVGVVVVNEENVKTHKMEPRVKYLNGPSGKFSKVDVKKLDSLGNFPNDDIGF